MDIDETRFLELEKQMFSKTDLHIHSNASFDANEDIFDILTSAKENNVNLIAITDHNTSDGVINYVKNNFPESEWNNMFHVDPFTGVCFVKGIEVSTRLRLNNGIITKLHICIYYSNIEKIKPLLDIIRIKQQEGQNYHQYQFRHICQKYKIEINTKEIDQFINLVHNEKGTYPKAYDIATFFKENKHLNVETKKLIDEIKSAPIPRRTFFDAGKIVAIAHNLGAVVTIAHPSRNLRSQAEINEVYEKLALCGLNGYEEYYCQISTKMHYVPATDETIKVFKSGGSDFHTFNSKKLIGTIDETNLFLNKATIISKLLETANQNGQNTTMLPFNSIIFDDQTNNPESYEKKKKNREKRKEKKNKKRQKTKDFFEKKAIKENTPVDNPFETNYGECSEITKINKDTNEQKLEK